MNITKVYSDKSIGISQFILVIFPSWIMEIEWCKVARIIPEKGAPQPHWLAGWVFHWIFDDDPRHSARIQR